MTPATLTGHRVRLLPLRGEHAAALARAGQDGLETAAQWTSIPSADAMPDYIARAQAGEAAGKMRAFVMSLCDTGEVVGTLRFARIDPRNRKCEIGYTWLAASWWGKGLHTESCYLLLRYAFECMACVRVQFQTDALNLPAAAALRKIGATEEGVARHERIMPDGRIRDSRQFSIIDTEWPAVRGALEARLRTRGIEPRYRMEGDTPPLCKGGSAAAGAIGPAHGSEG